MIVNKIIGLEETLKLQKQGADPMMTQGRCTGTSTCLALSYISEAIGDINTWVEIKDHYSGHNANTHLLSMISRIIDKLELQGFEYRLTPKPCIKCNIFEEYTKKTVWIKKENKN